MDGLINGLIIEFTFVMPANTLKGTSAGIQELFELVPGLRREDG